MVGAAILRKLYDLFFGHLCTLSNLSFSLVIFLFFLLLSLLYYYCDFLSSDFSISSTPIRKNASYPGLILRYFFLFSCYFPFLFVSGVFKFCLLLLCL